MTLVKIPVVWSDESPEIEQLKEMGISTDHLQEDGELGEVYINNNYVSHVNEVDGHTNVWVNESVFHVPLPIDDVVDLLEGRLIEYEL